MGNTEKEIRKDKMGWRGVTETSLHFQLGKTQNCIHHQSTYHEA